MDELRAGGGAVRLIDMPSDLEWMQRALGLGRRSVGLASPNPCVGCVIVRDGVVVGEGAHHYDELDHAEIVALKQAAERGLDVGGGGLEGATAYVTLEPCSHHGRTGPCADALIAAGVGRVVVSTQDPNPLVSGRGLERLRVAGVEVVVGVGEQEARALNDGFARWIRTGRPLVTLKAALSVDGMLAPPAAQRRVGQVHWLTSAAAREEVQRMRHGADAVLTGIGTVLADDPLLKDRSGLARRRPLLRVVLDSRLRLPLDSQLVRSADGDLLVFCGIEVAGERVRALEGVGVEVVRVEGDGGRLELEPVLQELGRRKILSLLLECGAELNGAFLAAGLVDKVVLFYAETELGVTAVPFAVGVGSPFLLEQSMKGVTREKVGVDVRVSGVLRDVWE